MTGDSEQVRTELIREPNAQKQALRRRVSAAKGRILQAKVLRELACLVASNRALSAENPRENALGQACCLGEARHASLMDRKQLAK